ncbi:MAG TPA: nucleotidyltransferase domain-containing protein [Methylobacter sp.]|jgi:predicted nucleotidyltransferase
MFGLSAETLAAINHCLQQYPDIVWVKIYGSRAKGDYERGSDIDLAYSSSIDCSADLLEALDNLPTPYLFDVTHYETLKHEGLKAHIDRVGRVIYQRTNQGDAK